MLFAAACHAGWNASIKSTLDPLATTVADRRSARALVALPFCAARRHAGRGVLAVADRLRSSSTCSISSGLIESYRAGDLGQVYPIARGSAPLMTALMTTLFVGERLGIYGWAGIVLLAAGVLLLSLRGGRDSPRSTAARSASRCSPR